MSRLRSRMPILCPTRRSGDVGTLEPVAPPSCTSLCCDSVWGAVAWCFFTGSAATLAADAATEAAFLAGDPFGPRFGDERGNIVLITSSSKKRRFFLRIRAGWKQRREVCETTTYRDVVLAYSKMWNTAAAAALWSECYFTGQNKNTKKRTTETHYIHLYSRTKKAKNTYSHLITRLQDKNIKWL